MTTKTTSECKDCRCALAHMPDPPPTILCSLHKATPALLAALQAVLAKWNEDGRIAGVDCAEFFAEARQAIEAANATESFDAERFLNEL